MSSVGSRGLFACLDLARTLVAKRPMALERENSKKWAKPVLVLGCLVGVG